MTTGDIVIVSFPFTNLSGFKARPAIVVKVLSDNYNYVIVCLISSVVSPIADPFQIIIHPNEANNLKAISVIKVGRIATIEFDKIKAVIEKISDKELDAFKSTFKKLVDEV